MGRIKLKKTSQIMEALYSTIFYSRDVNAVGSKEKLKERTWVRESSFWLKLGQHHQEDKHWGHGDQTTAVLKVRSNVRVKQSNNSRNRETWMNWRVTRVVESQILGQFACGDRRAGAQGQLEIWENSSLVWKTKYIEVT